MHPPVRTIPADVFGAEHRQKSTKKENEQDVSLRYVVDQAACIRQSKFNGVNIFSSSSKKNLILCIDRNRTGSLTSQSICSSFGAAGFVRFSLPEIQFGQKIVQRVHGRIENNGPADGTN